jgi:hypothetical protein
VVQALFREVPSPATSITWLLVLTVVFVFLAGRIISRREYVLEQ